MLWKQLYIFEKKITSNFYRVHVMFEMLISDKVCKLFSKNWPPSIRPKATYLQHSFEIFLPLYACVCVCTYILEEWNMSRSNFRRIQRFNITHKGGMGKRETRVRFIHSWRVVVVVVVVAVVVVVVEVIYRHEAVVESFPPVPKHQPTLHQVNCSSSSRFGYLAGLSPEGNEYDTHSVPLPTYYTTIPIKLELCCFRGNFCLCVSVVLRAYPQTEPTTLPSPPHREDTFCVMIQGMGNSVSSSKGELEYYSGESLRKYPGYFASQQLYRRIGNE